MSTAIKLASSIHSSSPVAVAGWYWTSLKTAALSEARAESAGEPSSAAAVSAVESQSRETNGMRMMAKMMDRPVPPTVFHSTPETAVAASLNMAMMSMRRPYGCLGADPETGRPSED